MLDRGADMNRCESRRAGFRFTGPPGTTEPGLPPCCSTGARTRMRTDQEGLTPLGVAEDEGSDKVARLLRERSDASP